MGVINAFYGALMGFWMVYEYESIISEKWLSLFPLIFLFFIIRKLCIFSKMPKCSKDKSDSLYISLFGSFFVSMLIQMAADPKIPLVKFLFFLKVL